MANIWVTSDTHFNHAAILNFTNDEGKKVRSFTSVEEMNEVMVENDQKMQAVYPGVSYLVIDGGHRVRALTNYYQNKFKEKK